MMSRLLTGLVLGFLLSANDGKVNVGQPAEIRTPRPASSEELQEEIEVLSEQRGYQTTTRLIDLFKSLPPASRLPVINALIQRTRDPRVNPLLFSHLMAREPFSGDYSDEDALLLWALGGYGPLRDETLRYLAKQTAESQWWDSPIDAGRVRDSLISLYFAKGQASAIFNRILAAMPPEAVTTDIIGIAAPDLGDKETVRILLSFLDGPDPVISPAEGPVVRLHKAARGALSALFPWVPEDEVEHFARTLPNDADFVDLYLAALDSQREDERTLVRFLIVRRLKTRNLKALLSWSQHEIHAMSDKDELSMTDCWLLASLGIAGSFDSLELLARGVEQPDADIREFSHRELVSSTGVDCGRSREAWRAWISAARAVLHYDELLLSWQPTTEWESIAKKAGREENVAD